MLLAYREVRHNFDRYKVIELKFKVINNLLILLLWRPLHILLQIMPDFSASFRGEAEGFLCVGECFLELIHVAVSV